MDATFFGNWSVPSGRTSASRLPFVQFLQVEQGDFDSGVVCIVEREPDNHT